MTYDPRMHPDLILIDDPHAPLQQFAALERLRRRPYMEFCHILRTSTAEVERRWTGRRIGDGLLPLPVDPDPADAARLAMGYMLGAFPERPALTSHMFCECFPRESTQGPGWFEPEPLLPGLLRPS